MTFRKVRPKKTNQDQDAVDLELKILANLNCIEAEAKPAGGWAFSHPNGTHDDIAFALALACWGATEGWNSDNDERRAF